MFGLPTTKQLLDVIARIRPGEGGQLNRFVEEFNGVFLNAEDPAENVDDRNVAQQPRSRFVASIFVTRSVSDESQ